MKTAFLSLLLGLSLAAPEVTAQCGAGGLFVQFSPPAPTIGQPITITVTNVSSNCVYLLPDTCVYKKIYSGQCGGSVVVPFRNCFLQNQAIQPGQSFVDSWDQKAFQGPQVPPGTYFFDMKIGTQGGSTVSLCPSVTIDSCPTPPVEYGAGSVGTAGFTPVWTIGSLPKPGGQFGLTIDNAVGGGSALYVLGAGVAQIPAPFGEFLVDPFLPIVYLPFTMSGSPGVGGDGSVTFGFVVPNDLSLVGVTVYSQCLVTDVNSSGGISHTRGLQVTVCPP